jgi:hypothetical protein
VRSPRLGSIGWFDFQRASEAIKIGADAAEKAIDRSTRRSPLCRTAANAAPK